MLQVIPQSRVDALDAYKTLIVAAARDMIHSYDNTTPSDRTTVDRSHCQWLKDLVERYDALEAKPLWPETEGFAVSNNYVAPTVGLP